MHAAESEFNAQFAPWGIVLPPDDVLRRRRGKICAAGWAIWYLFGANEKGEYLDHYSSHRMTNDSHMRIYFSGEVQGLPSLQGMRVCSPNPVEDARLEAAFNAENKRTAELLEAKGFGLQGDEPGGVQIIRTQILTNDSKHSKEAPPAKERRRKGSGGR